MKETKAKNPDYTKSAVSLTNSPELRDMLMVRQQKAGDFNALKEVLERTDESKALKVAGDALHDLDAQIKEAMTRLGGFQNIEQGLYALWQRRLTITYIPKLVRSILPKLAEALIEEVVNKEVMDGMLKGGVVTETQAQTCSEEKENLVPIIKT